MNAKCLAVFWLAASLCAAVCAQTPDSPVLAPVSSPSVTLATLLARARPLSSGVALTVGAEKTPRLPDAAPLPETPTVPAVAAATGRLLKRFGGVTALAPPMMVVLNANPQNPNPFDGMPPHEAMKLLAASLSPGQWGALTSERGLGAGDLTTDAQRGLFRALFPGGRLDVMKLTPQSDGGTRFEPPRDLSGELGQARLRLTQNTELMLQIVKGATNYSGGKGYDSTMGYSNGSSNASYGGLMSSDRAPRYQLAGGYGGAKDTLYGVVVRAEVPNAPKRGQLDYNLPALQAAIPLAGLKTVGDLVTRIGKTARLELYVDKRMETKTLTILGSAPSATAADLLRAAAFCLTGTFRHVGPAYVLTDDILGYGTRRKILQEFQSYADSLRRKSLEEAGDKLAAAKANESVRDFGQGIAATPEQIRKNTPPMYSMTQQQAIVYRADLNAAQREAVARMEAEITRVKAEPPPLPNGDVVLTSRPELQVLFPALDGPVEMPNAAQNLFKPSAKMQQALMDARMKQAQKTQADAPKPAPPVKRPPPPDWKALMQATTRRAVLVAPKNAAEVKPLVASMKTLGFNQLWLAAPNGGAPADDVLTAALKEAKGAGIAVFPVLDVLRWPLDAPADARDLTVLGETSVQTVARTYGTPDPDTYLPPPPSTLWVSPYAPAVHEMLRASVKDLSARPGVAGLVWRGVQPPGYDASHSSGMSSNAVPLGYTEPARLAFLRAAHADPVDLSENVYSNARTDLPNLGNDYQVEQPLIAQWQTARSTTLIGLLAALSAAVASPSKPAAARLPVFVQSAGQGWGGNWFGTWDTPRRPLPRFRNLWEDNQSGPTLAAHLQAKAQSRLALTRLQTWGGLNVGELSWQMHQQLKGKGWDGFVLDLTPDPQRNGPPLEQRANPLAALAASVAGGTGKADAGKAAAP